MLKKLMLSAAVSALMVSGAMAQASPPAADPPKAAAPKADAAPVDAAKFIASQSTDQWVFSKFKGTDVLGPDDAQVGGVNDILFDKQGKILALIVGVGGFLGIGEKSVAIDMSAFQAVPASTGSTAGGAGAAHGQRRPDQREAQGVVDQGAAQERAGLPVLQAAGTYDVLAGDLSDDRHGAAAADAADGAASVVINWRDGDG